MEDELIGTIKLFAGNFVPQGYLECNGQSIPITQNEALYSLLGITYGGDNRTQFSLPKLQSPIVGMRYIICVQGVYPSRQ
jgi:microcystin-dependent protein